MGAATKQDISDWLNRGKKEGATHVIVVCDDYDHEDYPVYVQPGEDPREVSKRFIGTNNMQQIMEVYKLSDDLEAQLSEHRAFHW